MRLLPLAAWSSVSLVGCALCCVPLFNLLGYESAAVLGVVVGLASVALTVDALRHAPGTGAGFGPRGSTPAADFCWLLPRTVGLVVPPLVLLTLNAARVKNCDPALGLEFLLLIPVVSAVLGQALLWAAAWLTPRSVLQVLLVLFVLGCDLVAFGHRLAFQPPITGHSVLFGWFAGSIYDEALSVPEHLWWYRLTLLGAVAAMVLATEYRAVQREGRRSRPVLVCLVAVTLPTVWGVASFKDHGIGLDREDIVERLGATTQTEHFVIHYNPARTAPALVEQMREDHEFRYAEMQAWLQTDPVAWRGRKITSFVYPNRREQERLMGSRGTLVARPWTHEMHIRYDRFRDGALAHELAHLFTAPFGGGPFQIATRGGLAPDIGLLEGIAMAADWPVGDLDPHEATAAMRTLGMAPDIRKAFGPAGFWSQPVGKAYTLMGSFVRWLVDTHGIDAFQAVYRKGDFVGVYGVSAQELVGDWEKAMDGIDVSDSKLALARTRYKRKSIFGRTCARTVSGLKREANTAASQGDLEGSLRMWAKIRGFQDGDPDEGVRGLEEARLLLRLKRWDDAASLLAPLLEGPEAERLDDARRALVHEAQGDLLWQGGDPSAAVEQWNRALGLGVGDSARRQLQVKRHAATQPDQAVRDLGRDYVLDPSNARSTLFEALAWAQASPSDPIPRYLLGLQLTLAQEPEAAVAVLAGAPGTLPSDHLDEQRRQLLVLNHYWLRQLDEADAVLQTLEGSDSARQADFAREFGARIAWLRSRTPAAPVASAVWATPLLFEPSAVPGSVSEADDMASPSD